MDNIEIKTAIVKTDISDHFPIIFATKNKIDAEITEQYIFKRNISDQSIDKFKQKLRNIDWNNIKILQNVNDAYSKFLEIICYSAALRCRSFSEKTSKECTCAVMIRIITTFANQIFL